MLQSLSHTLPENVEGHSPMGSAPRLLDAGMNFLRRQLTVIAAVTAAILVLAAIYLLVTPPSYTADATMIIDTRKLQAFQQPQQQGGGGGDLVMDSATVDSQVEILKSENVARAVIRKLRLAEDPDFNGENASVIEVAMGLVRKVLSVFSSSEPSSGDALETRISETFSRLLTVKRVGLTYVITISFRAMSPERAAEIANAVVDAYVADQLDAKYETTRRASVWMQDRIKELRQQAADAEAAVATFKGKNNIVETGGRLTTEQQLAEVNSQIVQARATTAEAKAKLDRVDEIIKSEIPDAAVADSLKSDVVIKLRQQYIEFAAKEADISSKYGRAHLAAVNLRQQMQHIKDAILDELKRVAQTYRSDYEIAKVREDSVQQSMSEAVTQSQSTSQAQLMLKDLESSSQNYRALHDSFQQRYMEAVQQQSFPITEARSISKASPPLHKSHPRSTLIMAASMFGGLLLGAGIGLLRDQFDRAFRTSRQIEDELHLDCLSILPDVRENAAKPFRIGWTGNKGQPSPASTNNALTYAAHSPFSRFAESVRAIKVAVDIEAAKTGITQKVIGICSSLPNEGKSTVAANLAQLIAKGGARTVLIDCDLRNPSLSHILAPDAPVGLLEVLVGRATLDQALRKSSKGNLGFIPIVSEARLADTSEIFQSEQMKRFFDVLKQRFEYIVVDLPPLAPVVDVRVTAHLIDFYILVVEWGRTKSDVAQQALTSARGIYEQTLGVVLNKADMQTFGRYQGDTGDYYSDRHYGRYTREGKAREHA